MEKTIQRLPITHDYVFKRVFSYEGNESVLKDFLEAVLKIKIKKVEVKNPELIKNSKKDKKGILDIKVEMDNNVIIDIEMQAKDEKNIIERSTTYTGKMIASQLQQAETYGILRKTIFIGILNFNYIKRNSYHNVGKMKFEETEQEEYVDMGYKEEETIASPFIEMHFIELPKFRKKKPGIDTKLDQWLWFLSGKEEMIEMAEKENKEIKKAADTLDRISLDPKEREIYESIVQAEFNQKVSNQKFLEEGIEKGRKEGIREGKAEGIKEGKAEGIKEGKAEGIKEGKAEGIKEGKAEGIKEGKAEGEKKKGLEVAKNLLKKDMDVKTIAEVTGISESEIEKLVETE